MSRKERQMYRKSLNPQFKQAKPHVITVRLTEPEFQRIEALALKKRVKRSALIRHYIQKGMKEEPKNV